jgi:hypothetical protein
MTILVSFLAISFRKIGKPIKLETKCLWSKKILLPRGRRCEFVERLDYLFIGHPVPPACHITFHIMPVTKVLDHSCNMKLFILNVIYVGVSKYSWYHSISEKH